MTINGDNEVGWWERNPNGVISTTQTITVGDQCDCDQRCSKCGKVKVPHAPHIGDPIPYQPYTPQWPYDRSYTIWSGTTSTSGGTVR